MKPDDTNDHFSIKQNVAPRESDDDYLDADAYSSLKARHRNGFTSGGLRSRGVMIALVIVVLAVLLFLFWSIPKPRQVAEDASVMAIKTRIQQMESQLNAIEGNLAELQNLKSQLAASNEIGGRLDRLEASSSMRIGDLDQKITELDKKMSQAMAQIKKSSSANKAAAQPKKKTPPKPKIRYHTVTAGETLYSISNKYGISLTTLKKVNNFKGNAIQPGQKLRVTP